MVTKEPIWAEHRQATLRPGLCALFVGCDCPQLLSPSALRDGSVHEQTYPKLSTGGYECRTYMCGKAEALRPV